MAYLVAHNFARKWGLSDEEQEKFCKIMFDNIECDLCRGVLSEAGCICRRNQW